MPEHGHIAGGNNIMRSRQCRLHNLGQLLSKTDEKGVETAWMLSISLHGWWRLAFKLSISTSQITRSRLLYVKREDMKREVHLFVYLRT